MMELVTVIDVYGRRHRVREDHILDAGKMLLPRFNQYGDRVKEDSGILLHRDNIKKGSA